MAYEYSQSQDTGTSIESNIYIDTRQGLFDNIKYNDKINLADLKLPPKSLITRVVENEIKENDDLEKLNLEIYENINDIPLTIEWVTEQNNNVNQNVFVNDDDDDDDDKSKPKQKIEFRDRNKAFYTSRLSKAISEKKFLMGIKDKIEKRKDVIKKSANDTNLYTYSLTFFKIGGVISIVATGVVIPYYFANNGVEFFLTNIIGPYLGTSTAFAIVNLLSSVCNITLTNKHSLNNNLNLLSRENTPANVEAFNNLFKTIFENTALTQKPNIDLYTDIFSAAKLLPHAKVIINALSLGKTFYCYIDTNTEIFRAFTNKDSTLSDKFNALLIPTSNYLLSSDTFIFIRNKYTSDFFGYICENLLSIDPKTTFQFYIIGPIIGPTSYKYISDIVLQNGFSLVSKEIIHLTINKTFKKTFDHTKKTVTLSYDDDDDDSGDSDRAKRLKELTDNLILMGRYTNLDHDDIEFITNGYNAELNTKFIVSRHMEQMFKYVRLMSIQPGLASEIAYKRAFALFNYSSLTTFEIFITIMDNGPKMLGYTGVLWYFMQGYINATPIINSKWHTNIKLLDIFQIKKTYGDLLWMLLGYIGLTDLTGTNLTFKIEKYIDELVTDIFLVLNVFANKLSKILNDSVPYKKIIESKFYQNLMQYWLVQAIINVSSYVFKFFYKILLLPGVKLYTSKMINDKQFNKQFMNTMHGILTNKDKAIGFFSLMNDISSKNTNVKWGFPLLENIVYHEFLNVVKYDETNSNATISNGNIDSLNGQVNFSKKIDTEYSLPLITEYIRLKSKTEESKTEESKTEESIKKKSFISQKHKNIVTKIITKNDGVNIYYQEYSADNIDNILYKYLDEYIADTTVDGDKNYIGFEKWITQKSFNLELERDKIINGLVSNQLIIDTQNYETEAEEKNRLIEENISEIKAEIDNLQKNDNSQNGSTRLNELNKLLSDKEQEINNNKESIGKRTRQKQIELINTITNDYDNIPIGEANIAIAFLPSNREQLTEESFSNKFFNMVVPEEWEEHFFLKTIKYIISENTTADIIAELPLISTGDIKKPTNGQMLLLNIPNNILFNKARFFDIDGRKIAVSIGVTYEQYVDLRQLLTDKDAINITYDLDEYKQEAGLASFVELSKNTRNKLTANEADLASQIKKNGFLSILGIPIEKENNFVKIFTELAYNTLIPNDTLTSSYKNVLVHIANTHLKYLLKSCPLELSHDNLNNLNSCGLRYDNEDDFELCKNFIFSPNGISFLIMNADTIFDSIINDRDSKLKDFKDAAKKLKNMISNFDIPKILIQTYEKYTNNELDDLLKIQTDLQTHKKYSDIQPNMDPELIQLSAKIESLRSLSDQNINAISKLFDFQPLKYLCIDFWASTSPFGKNPKNVQNYKIDIQRDLVSKIKQPIFKNNTIDTDKALILFIDNCVNILTFQAQDEGIPLVITFDKLREQGVTYDMLLRKKNIIEKEFKQNLDNSPIELQSLLNTKPADILTNEYNYDNYYNIHDNLFQQASDLLYKNEKHISYTLRLLLPVQTNPNNIISILPNIHNYETDTEISEIMNNIINYKANLLEWDANKSAFGIGINVGYEPSKKEKEEQNINADKFKKYISEKISIVLDNQLSKIISPTEDNINEPSYSNPFIQYLKNYDDILAEAYKHMGIGRGDNSNFIPFASDTQQKDNIADSKSDNKIGNQQENTDKTGNYSSQNVYKNEKSLTNEIDNAMKQELTNEIDNAIKEEQQLQLQNQFDTTFASASSGGGIGKFVDMLSNLLNMFINGNIENEIINGQLIDEGKKEKEVKTKCQQTFNSRSINGNIIHKLNTDQTARHIHQNCITDNYAVQLLSFLWSKTVLLTNSVSTATYAIAGANIYNPAVTVKFAMYANIIGCIPYAGLCAMLESLNVHSTSDQTIYNFLAATIITYLSLLVKNINESSGVNPSKPRCIGESYICNYDKYLNDSTKYLKKLSETPESTNIYGKVDLGEPNEDDITGLGGNMDSGRIFMQITLGITEYMADFKHVTDIIEDKNKLKQLIEDDTFQPVKEESGLHIINVLKTLMIMKKNQLLGILSSDDETKVIGCFKIIKSLTNIDLTYFFNSKMEFDTNFFDIIVKIPGKCLNFTWLVLQNLLTMNIEWFNNLFNEIKSYLLVYQNFIPNILYSFSLLLSIFLVHAPTTILGSLETTGRAGKSLNENQNIIHNAFKKICNKHLLMNPLEKSAKANNVLVNAIAKEMYNIFFSFWTLINDYIISTMTSILDYFKKSKDDDDQKKNEQQEEIIKKESILNLDTYINNLRNIRDIENGKKQDDNTFKAILLNFIIDAYAPRRTDITITNNNKDNEVFQNYIKYNGADFNPMVNKGPFEIPIPGELEKKAKIQVVTSRTITTDMKLSDDKEKISIDLLNYKDNNNFYFYKKYVYPTKFTKPDYKQQIMYRSDNKTTVKPIEILTENILTFTACKFIQYSVCPYTKNIMVNKDHFEVSEKERNKLIQELIQNKAKNTERKNTKHDLGIKLLSTTDDNEIRLIREQMINLDNEIRDANNNYNIELKKQNEIINDTNKTDVYQLEGNDDIEIYNNLAEKYNENVGKENTNVDICNQFLIDCISIYNLNKIAPNDTDAQLNEKIDKFYQKYAKQIIFQHLFGVLEGEPDKIRSIILKTIVENNKYYNLLFENINISQKNIQTLENNFNLNKEIAEETNNKIMEDFILQNSVTKLNCNEYTNCSFFDATGNEYITLIDNASLVVNQINELFCKMFCIEDQAVILNNSNLDSIITEIEKLPIKNLDKVMEKLFTTICDQKYISDNKPPSDNTNFDFESFYKQLYGITFFQNTDKVINDIKVFFLEDNDYENDSVYKQKLMGFCQYLESYNNYLKQPDAKPPTYSQFREDFIEHLLEVKERTIQQQQDDSITKKDEIELTIILENTRDSYLEKFDQIVEQTIQIGKQINDNVITPTAEFVGNAVVKGKKFIKYAASFLNL